MSKSEEAWVGLQAKCFLAWANSKLKREDWAKSVNDFAGDCLLLISLLEIVSGKTMKRYEKKPKSRIQYLVNAKTCIEFMEKIEHIKMVSFSAETYVDGNVKMVLALLWGIVRKYQISAAVGGVDEEPLSGDATVVSNSSGLRRGLLKWVQEATQLYGIEVKDFSSSFADGKAFQALLQHVNPDGAEKLNTKLQGKSNEEKLKIMFETAEVECNIPPLLFPLDVAQGQIDELACMTYVSYFANVDVVYNTSAEIAIQTDPVQFNDGREKDKNSVDLSLYEEFKRNVERQFLVYYYQDSIKESNIADALTTAALNLKKEEERYVQLENKINELLLQVQDLQQQVYAASNSGSKKGGMVDSKLSEKLSDAEIQHERTIEEAKGCKNIRSMLSADLWLAEQAAMKGNTKTTYALGPEINARVDAVATQYHSAGAIIEELRGIVRGLQLKSNQKDAEIDNVFFLMRGEVLMKYSSSGKKPQKRFFFVHFFQQPTIFWADADSLGAGQSQGSTKIAEASSNFNSFKSDDFKQCVIKEVVEGVHMEVAKKNSLSENVKTMSFHIQGHDRRLDLIAPNSLVYRLWTKGLAQILHDYNKGLIGLSATSKNRSKPSATQANLLGVVDPMIEGFWQ